MIGARKKAYKNIDAHSRYPCNFPGLSPSEVAEYLLSTPDGPFTLLASLRDDGIPAVPPLKPRIYLESVNDNKISIVCGGRMQLFWRVIISILQTEDGCSATTEVINLDGAKTARQEFDLSEITGAIYGARNVLNPTRR